MYCSNCGEKANDGAKFCSNCGKSFGDVLAQKNMSNVMSDEQHKILQQLEIAMPIYQTIAEKEAGIQMLQQERDKRRKGTVASSVFAVIAGAFVGIVLLFIIGVNFESWFPDGEGFMTIIYIDFAFCIMSALLLNEKRKIKDSSGVNERVQQKEAELSTYIENNNIPELYYLPEKYRYYNAAQYIEECIKNKRAHNLTDAINLYEEQLYRWRMENYQYSLYIVNLQQMALLRLRR